jgi:hypothetical protein
MRKIMAETYQLVQIAFGSSIVFTFIVHGLWLMHVRADCALHYHTAKSLKYSWQPIVQGFKPPVSI